MLKQPAKYIYVVSYYKDGNRNHLIEFATPSEERARADRDMYNGQLYRVLVPISADAHDALMLFEKGEGELLQ